MVIFYIAFLHTILQTLFNKQQKLRSLGLLSLIVLYSAPTITATTIPLSTNGNQIVDANNNSVRLQAVSWFGFETPNLVPHGLWARSYSSMMDQMKSLGFNAIRIPYCNQMFDAGQSPNSINYNLNPDLTGLNSIQILDKIIAYADIIGLWIILDHHRSEAGESAEANGLWYTTAYPESRFISDWVMLATRYKQNPSVIGADVHNEPHGPATWGDGSSTDWRAAAQRVGNAILAVNPKLLIIVEGIEAVNNDFYWWGGNLMAAGTFPVVLNIPNKVVYSPHDYPDSVYPQPWFSAPNFPANMPGIFTQMWGYIAEQGLAPIWLGEFGSQFVDPKDIQWMNELVPYLNGGFSASGSLPKGDQGLSWSWWAWNPDSGDTGGILENDWQTPDQNKLTRMAPLFTFVSTNTGITPPPPPPPAPTQTSVNYVVQSLWNNGFIGSVTITNLSTAPITAWQLVFTFPGNQQITNLWNGIVQTQNNQVTVNNASYNGTILSGQSVQFGFQATYSGTSNNPTSFTLNGTPCTIVS